MNVPLTGLTWDHPRGYRALEAAMAAEPSPSIHWSRQPLEGFESHPIADLAARYDILVLDHPHIGEAIAEDCLQPLESVFSAGEIAAWGVSTIGPALRSYRWDGRHFALPLDVATQVAARDPDLLPGSPPDTWDEVQELSERAPVALSLAGPHAVLTFLSLCVSLGHEPGGDMLVEQATGEEALEQMKRIARRAPSGSEQLNPIRLLEAVAARAGIAFVPLVYGYVAYAVSTPDRKRVAFSEAPLIRAGGRRGSVLGGTGIALTRRARPTPALLDHLRLLMSQDAQTGFIPKHDGQPSLRAAWTSDAVNAAWGGFYSATLETTEHAWVRPRFDGYIAFQNQGSAAIRDGLSGQTSIATTLNRLRTLWTTARAAARGPLQA